MNDTQSSKKEKNQHIQVFVRVRPISSAEKNGTSTSVVEVPSQKEVLIHEKPQDKCSKKFTFDGVFGPKSKQIDVYNAVVSPLLKEVLAGYNCTVFAYGQTGTGKTFTMEGVSNDPALHWQSDTYAGMIPRFLSHLFDELRLLEAQEYTVRVSFLELYNEELFDLLSTSDDASRIRLYEDASRKGGVIIHGLEEVTVHNKSEVYKILETGSEKRKTAATLMNAHSSRSHTVFSITVHMKENAVGGEDLLKTGKLNLVDLAGSESVGRSGAVDRRAREAGSINQSLLTLGRVIIALVERTPHVPYRESKLTRLLQESLGGRTKTSIIATISPASINIEETLSTLDYAHRAKNITNKPEINQKLSKKALLKEYTEEIERLRKDLLATRERNGVYLAHDNFSEMQTTIEQQGKEIEMKINHIKALEEAMRNKEKILNECHLEFAEQCTILQKTKNDLDVTTHALKSTKQRLTMVEQDKDEQKYILEKRVANEKLLLSQVHDLLGVVDTAIEDANKLHDKILRKTQVEQRNAAAGQQFKNTISRNLAILEKDLSAYTNDLNQFCENMKMEVDREIRVHSENIATAITSTLAELKDHHSETVDNLVKSMVTSYECYKGWSQKELAKAIESGDKECEILTNISSILVNEVCKMSETAIVEYLQQLNKDLQMKFACITVYAKEFIDTAHKCRLNDYNLLTKNVSEIKSKVNQFLQRRSTMLQKRRIFAKAMNELFTQFNSINAYEEESHSIIESDCNDMSNICSTFNNYMEDAWQKNVSAHNLLEENVRNGVGTIKKDVLAFAEKHESASKEIIDKANILQNDLQSTVVATKNMTLQYTSSLESDVTSLCNRIGDDRITILNTVEDLQNIVDQVSITHTQFANEQSLKASNVCTNIAGEVDAQNFKCTEWNKKQSNDLRAMEQRLNKFFVEEMQRDVATGLTPAKRAFSYPRQFVITSPHERILNRFREARKLVETSDEDDTTLSSCDLTMKAVANSTAISDISLTSRGEDSNSRSISDITILASPADAGQPSSSTLIVSSMTKLSHSCDAIDSCVKNVERRTSTLSISKTSRVRSESEIYIRNENKENKRNSNSRSRNTRSIQSPKLKRGKRPVLGTYN